jgi:hypothetical protein
MQSRGPDPAALCETHYEEHSVQYPLRGGKTARELEEVLHFFVQLRDLRAFVVRFSVVVCGHNLSCSGDTRLPFPSTTSIGSPPFLHVSRP